MNLDEAYRIVDACEYIQFPGEIELEGTVRLNGFFNVEQLEAAKVVLDSRVNLSRQQLSLNHGRSVCISCAGRVAGNTCVECDL